MEYESLTAWNILTLDSDTLTITIEIKTKESFDRLSKKVKDIFNDDFKEHGQGVMKRMEKDNES